MWFHHVPWDHRMASGRTFWDELVYRYQMGVEYVTWMRETWDVAAAVRRRAPLRARSGRSWPRTRPTPADWRDTNVNYWHEFSGRDNPVGRRAAARPRSS